MQKQNHPTNIDRMILIVYLIRQVQNSFGNLSLSFFSTGSHYTPLPYIP